MSTQRIVIFAFAGIVVVGTIYFATRRSAAPPSGESIAWTDIGTAYTTAPAANKKMLVDVYTDWCTWCKTMDKKTYGNAAIASYIHDHFIPVKLNAESQTVRQSHAGPITDEKLAQSFGVSGYPTTVFANADGSMITSIDGYVDTTHFITVLRYIAEEQYRSQSFEQFQQSVH